MSYHLMDVMQQSEHTRLLVIGGLILDRHLWGESIRVGQESPVILLRQESKVMRLRGATMVANVIRGFDTDVTISQAVSLNSDNSTKRLKGVTRPSISQQQRATILAAFECVDHTITFDKDTHIALFEQLRIYILVNGRATSVIVGRNQLRRSPHPVRRLERFNHSHRFTNLHAA